MATREGFRARRGDRVLVEARKVGAGARFGRALEVLGTPGTERYRIGWEDGHESVCAPSSDMRFERKRKQKPASAKTAA
jgi:hypothetical protein